MGATSTTPFWANAGEPVGHPHHFAAGQILRTAATADDGRSERMVVHSYHSAARRGTHATWTNDHGHERTRRFVDRRTNNTAAATTTSAVAATTAATDDQDQLSSHPSARAIRLAP